MWEFMSNYADMFWSKGEEVLTVIMAWAITLGTASIVFGIIHLFAMKIKWTIEDINKERKKHGL